VLVGIPVVAAAQGDATAKGAQVYAAQKCSVCHSIDGVGSKLTVQDIREWIVDAKGMTAKTKAPRKPEMRHYALPPDEVDTLVAYLASLKK
jgi:mono/diheme cytochrome c family protein